MSHSAQSQADHGFTMVELTITMALTMTVMAALLGIVVSQSNAERRISTFADNQELIRQAIVALQRDVRSSKPLTPLATSPEYALRVDLEVYDSLSDPPVPVRWLVDTSAGELRREMLAPDGTITGVTHRLKGVANDANEPLFTLYGGDDEVLDLGAEQTGDVAACTVRVHIDLVAAPTPGPAPARLSSDAELRNRPAGAGGCPTGTPTP